MAIQVHFRHEGFTRARYDETISRLEASGQDHPAGRINHVAIDVDGEIEVIDVWESGEALERFGATGFVPILLELGVELHDPTVTPIHNVIVG